MQILVISNEGYIKCKECVNNITENDRTHLKHICDSQYLVSNKNRNLICYSENYTKSKMNTKNIMIDLPNKFL